MPSIQPADLDTVERALTLQEGWDKALAVIKTVRDNLATDAEVAAANEKHVNDECEIDDGASSSRSDEGVWVQAWVWVRLPDCEVCDGNGYPGDDAVVQCETCGGSGRVPFE